MDGKKSRVRLSLELSSEANDVLVKLAQKTGGTKSDILRKAIALMLFAVEAKEKGQKVGIAEDGQTLATEIIGL
jgi:predicted DNA-binding protein